MSIASLWEIAVETSIGKLTLREPFETLPVVTADAAFQAHGVPQLWGEA